MDGDSTTGRAPDRRVARTRRALKEALTQLVLERGYEAVSVRDVIERADVGRSTFYTHFLDKDDLMLAVFRDVPVPPPDVETWSPSEPPFFWTGRLFRHVDQARHLFRAVIGSGASPIARRETEAWIEGLARAEFRRLGAGRTTSAEVLDLCAGSFVHAYLALVEWWTDQARTAVTADEADARFRQLVLPGLLRTVGIDEPR